MFKIGDKVKVKWHYNKDENCNCIICKQGYGWIKSFFNYKEICGLSEHQNSNNNNIIVFYTDTLEIFQESQKQLNLFEEI